MSKIQTIKKDIKMAVRPNPYKLECPNCGYSRVVSPRSDALSPKDLLSMNPVCPKCKGMMDKKSANVLDTIFSIFK
jgi:Zn finger protein HypA/HybF involved in hydrogenase expression